MLRKDGKQRVVCLAAKERQRLTRQRCGTLQTNIGKLAKQGEKKEVLLSPTTHGSPCMSSPGCALAAGRNVFLTVTRSKLRNPKRPVEKDS